MIVNIAKPRERTRAAARGYERVIDTKILNNSAYIDLSRAKTSAINALKQAYYLQGKPFPNIEKLFDKNGKSTMQDHVLRQ